MPTDSQPDPRRHVFRYDEHMPDTDDLAIVVLKGHLLVEEMLNELARLALPHPTHLDRARLSFLELACVARAVAPRDQDNCWELIIFLNSLRNALVHRLDPPQLQERLSKLFAIDSKSQQFTDITIDKTPESVLGDIERVRQAVTTCMQFLSTLVSHFEGNEGNAKTAAK